MPLMKLKEDRAKAVAMGREYINRAENENRAMNAEEETAYGKALGDVKSIKARIDRMEEIAAEERESAMTDYKREEKKSEGDKPGEMQNKAFGHFLAGGLAGMTSEMRNALAASPNTSGGYLAPDAFVSDLIKKMDDDVFIRNLATKYSVSTGGSLGIPSLDANPADFAWTPEIGAASEDSSMSFGKRELKPNQLTKLVKVSRKLLRVSTVNPEALVGDRLAYVAGTTQESVFMTGTGASQPLGLFTASTMGITTAQDISTGNSTTAMTFDGLKNIKYGLKPQYRRVAKWLFHSDGVLQLAKLKDGDGQYIWQASVKDQENDVLMGIPVLESQFAPNTFTTGLYVGMLGDFSKYVIADLMGMEIQRLDERYAETNQVGFIARLEVDGMPVLAEAFRRVKLA